MFTFQAHLRYFFVVLVIVSTLHTWALEAESGQKEFVETETVIAEVPEGAQPVGESVRPRPGDGKLAYVYESDRGFKVCMNDTCGPYVDRVAKGMPVVSPDGNHFAAVVQSDDKARVMLGGGMSAPYDMVYDLNFSPDSMILAYIAKKDDAFFVYTNQKRHEAFAMVDTSQGLVFSRDASRLAYVASRDGESWHLVRNGEAGEPFEQIKHVTFSPDSKRLAYAAKVNGKWHLVEDEDMGPGYDDIMFIAFGPESEQLAYVAREGDKSLVVKDGEKSRRFDHIIGEVLFSDDGERMAYAVAEERRRGVRMRMVVDGETGPRFEQIGAYWFSPDGTRIVYMAVDSEKGRIVEGDKRHDAYDSVGIPAFSPDGSHMAYRFFEDGQWRVKKNGEKGPAFDYADDPVFCPNGERLAYLARQGEAFVVVENGEIVGSYEQAGGLTFSPDGRHLAYTAVQDGKSFLVVDGTKGMGRELIVLTRPGLVFTENNTVQKIALSPGSDDGLKAWLIKAEITAE